jgi:hypothetical protein
MQLTMLRSTTQRDIIWFLMLVHMSFCHILGTRILIVIIHNNFSSFKPKDNNLRFMCNNLRLRVNNFKYKALRLRPKDSRDNKLLA